MGFIIGEKMFWALMLNPEAFYKEFSTDTASFNAFYDRIDVAVFLELKMILHMLPLE